MDQQCDLITGGPLPDHDDEYVRQKVEAYLLRLGYQPEDVRVDHCRTLKHHSDDMSVKADLLIMANGAPALVLRCARGSLVSREREGRCRGPPAGGRVDSLCRGVQRRRRRVVGRCHRPGARHGPGGPANSRRLGPLGGRDAPQAAQRKGNACGGKGLSCI